LAINLGKSLDLRVQDLVQILLLLHCICRALLGA
jgi:hypothetical protein